MSRRQDISGMMSETVIGAGVKVKGDVHSDGDIVIDGHLTGDVSAGGNVELGVNAVVKANISARSLSIAGQLKGNVTIQDTISILATGKLVGNIKTDSIMVESGGVLIGNVSMPATHSLEEIRDETSPQEHAD